MSEAVRDAGPETPLGQGERLLGAWRPQWALFLQRAVLLSFVTALVLASLGYLTLWQWLVAVPVFTLIFMVVFDDFSTWFRHRGERWFLTDRRLIFETRDAPEENSAVPLGAIEWLKPWFWWSLRMGFDGGTATAMRFVARPKDIRARILDARDNLHGTVQGKGGEHG